MRIKLAYGKDGHWIDLPDAWDVTVIEPRYVPGVADPVAALRDALAAPIDAPPLRTRVKATDHVGIVFSDISRATPNGLILPAVLAELAHMPPAQITLFCALGTHRANTEAELRALLAAGATPAVGDDLFNRFRIVQNDAFDPETQVNLGVTAAGHAIWLNRALVECDVKILTGFIEPHFFAGFSGGGKALMPGMAGLRTVLGNHDAAKIADPHATWGMTNGNPIWEEVMEVAHSAGGTFLVNVTLNKDKAITGVFAGDLDAAYAAGCAYVKQTAMVPVPHRYDIVITTNSGYPLDLNLYQTVKGMSAAAEVVRQGGAIVVASECWDGIPEHGLYGRLLREADSPRELLARILAPGFLEQDQWQAQVQAQIQQHADVYVYSDRLSDEQIRGALLAPCPSIEDTVAALRAQIGAAATICVLPEGPQTIPYVTQQLTNPGIFTTQQRGAVAVKSKLKIVMITSECVPYAKTGGLADVTGALPQVLRSMGHEVIVVMPRYGIINGAKFGLSRFWDSMGVWMGNTQEWCSVDTADNDGVPTYFIESNKYFERAGLYHDENFNDFLDNPRRFAFLTRAGLQLCQDLGFAPDIVHVHDWQTALASAYLKIWHWNDPLLGNAASVLTIHNIAYQGKYPASHYDYLGLQWGNFTPDKFEDYGDINFLKGGIAYADMVNTVSPTYAAETRTPTLGYGMAPYLNDKGADYVGILNGIDYTQWNPAVDTLIPARYTPDNLAGKVVCKQALQARFMLEPNPNIPIVGVVSRLATQKGLDLLAATIERIVQDMAVQFVLLGSGDKVLESFYAGLPARYPGRVGTYIGYSNEVAHRIEAGADFFIMPSIYEPCGLNQIYSLKYGTLPIVRATGGLEDTVQQYDEATGAGTGFKFWEPSPAAIYYTVGWAVSTYYDRPQHIKQMIQTAMAQDYSWEKSAAQYVEVYERAMANKGIV